MSTERTLAERSVRDRLLANPQPAVAWVAVLVFLVAIEFGGLMSAVMSIPWDVVVGGIADVLRGTGALAPLADGLIAVAAVLAAAGDALASLPTLLSREVIPNQGYNPPGAGWEGTFLGLPPALAWAIRAGAIYAYGIGCFWWCWQGYLLYRRHYRRVDWAPIDDVVRRFRNHGWGRFGLVIVAVFVLTAIFAPSLGMATQDQNIQDPYSYTIQHYDEEAGGVDELTVGAANMQSASIGEKHNVGIGQYDDFGRFHPFGTLSEGKDLWTFMVHGSRVSLFVGLVAVTISSVIALTVALMAAYYRGRVDMSAIFVSDAVSALPGLLVIIMLAIILGDTWLAKIYSGGLLLALIFGGFGWTGMWRAIRGPALQSAQREWIDAAESFGEKPRVIVRKHITPYVIGYLLVYASMSIGGVIIGTAGLSFLGIGINAPTPEWGRAVSLGQTLVTSPSWHISIIPGIAVTVLVIGFNALGDGIRDAIDPETDEGGSEPTVTTTGGGA